jgi:HK97 family phage prohead protease
MTNRQAMIDISRFHALAKKSGAPAGTCVRLALASEPSVSTSGRIASFIFSDNSVDSYGDTIDARGWDLKAFAVNPVALFGHDPSRPENIIGKAVNVRVEGNRLVGDIEFAEASVNPNAETVYQMVKGGYLNAVSVGFQPQEWAFAKDKSRPGGIDFAKQKLLEISVVAIPANENALVQARAAGIEIDRLALSPPIVRDRKVTKKGLCAVSALASLLAELGWLEESVEWEADYEGDGSEIPQRLTDAMNLLGQILVDMTIEEVAELLADDESDDGGPVELVALAAPTEAQKAFLRLAQLATKAKSPAPTIPAIIERAGKVLSSANETKLRDAHGVISGACEVIMSVIGSNTPEGPADTTSTAAADAQAMAARARKAKALKLQHALGDAA